MPCSPCAIVRQLASNTLLTVDRVVNALLGGDPNETLSQRTARAELAGSRAAALACRLMGWVHPDHCRWSLTPGTIGREVWAWSEPVGPRPLHEQPPA